MTIDPETIGAFVDGELNEIERRRVEAAMAGDPELAAQVDAERKLRALLRARFDPVAEEPVPERLVAAVREGATVAPLRPRRAWAAPQWIAVAASLVVGVLVGRQVQAPHNPMTPSSALSRALETQLTSAQGAGANVRIGLTFKAHDGAWCRTFEERAVQGIACRAGGAWRLRRAETAPAQQSEYRQAGSDAMAAVAQDMAADAPLDAEQERATVADGWK